MPVGMRTAYNKWRGTANRPSRAMSRKGTTVMPKLFRECKSDNSPNGKHSWKKWNNETHENTGKVMGPMGHVVFHCHYCGKIKK
jgi:hypothetical protein